MTTAKEIENSNSTVSPPQSPPQKKQKTPKMLPEIPEHIIFYEILSRIPAKILVTFKLVSHQWNSFILYPNTRFGNTHLSLSTSTLNSRSVLTIAGTPFFESVDYEKVVGLNLDITKYGTNLLNRVPLWLLSSCNGLGFLICVHDVRLKCKCEHKCECRCDDFELQLPDDLHEFEFHYLVCNPVLGIDSFVEIDHPHDQIYLGSSSDNNAGKSCYNFGFGYVSSLDDYNIVVIALPRGVVRSEVVVYVYSLRLLRWGTPRKFKQDRLPLVFQNVWYNEIGILVKETLHWGVTIGENQKCIAAFDLAAQDEFKFMQLPYAEFGNARRRPVNPCFCLCCLDGCLCAWANYVDDDDDGRIDLVEMWMMKKYGVNESWTKLFRCDLGYYPRNIFGFTKAGMVLIHVPADELRLIDVSCDPPRDMGIVVKDIWEAVNYVQSLVSPLAIMSEQEE